MPAGGPFKPSFGLSGAFDLAVAFVFSYRNIQLSGKNKGTAEAVPSLIKSLKLSRVRRP
jgi:hypothetical protein